MQKYKPKYHIETRFEKQIKFKEGDIRNYYNEQIIEYCNGICYWDYDENSYERKNWADLYYESKLYNKSLDISRYGQSIWTNKYCMDQAFEKFFLNYSPGEGVYTPMTEFEIWLMCNGYKMISFDKMCAQRPCVYIVGDMLDQNKIKNPSGVLYTRFYHNDNTGKTIYFSFDINTENIHFNFYFTHSDRMYESYQIPIKTEYFEKAERLELKSIRQLESEIIKQKI